MTGIAESTACLIVIEFCEAIINNLWHDCFEKKLEFEKQNGKMRPDNEVRSLLEMKECRIIRDTNAAAKKIQDTSTNKFILEKWGFGVD